MVSILMNNYKKLFILFFICFTLLFINNAVSPLFSIEYLNHDVSTFYLGGRGLKYGKIFYKDLVDHKGPYIWFINFIACIILEYRHISK